MTCPETLGAAGGAISPWLKVIDCLSDGGIVSSHQSGTTSSVIHCNDGQIWYDTHLLPKCYKASS